jgi:mRNA-degrading endonuclease RelE of RelBE toxin-antitoxin system
MTYLLDFAPDARNGLRQLESVAQEMALDAIEEVAARPFASRQFSIRGGGVHDFVYEAAGMRHTIFILMSVSHSRQTVHILQIGQSSHPIVP